MFRKSQSADHEAKSLYSKATKAELSKDYNIAFQFYVKAAESYLHLSRSSNITDKDKANWNAQAAKALERAEKLKNFIQRPSSTISSPVTPSTPQSSTSEVKLAPVAINHFSSHEQSYILKKGEIVNGLQYPPWDEPTTSRCGIFSDPDGQPQLSPEQRKVSAAWRRPNGPSDDFIYYFTQRILPEDILQHIVTDCSVCASISVCLAHDNQFGSSLAKLAIYPTSEGRYDVKAFFNGAWRRILIDDSLPYNPMDNSLMCMSVLPLGKADTGITPIIWPSLLEKAYIKLMGGYDFPGSNSSIDLHVLIGWIPDHIEVKSSSFEREKTWTRMLNGFLNGQCVVTVGTGIHSTHWRNIDLLPSHSYAVIDVTEEEGDRRVTILDSWVRPKEGDNTQSSRILRIPWTDVLHVFDGIYLSWDPQTRPNIKTFHCMWKRNSDDEPSHQARLKFLNNASEEEVWILLTRHIVETQRTTDFISLRVEVEDDSVPVPRTVDLHTISSTGTYTNSSHVLVRSRIPRSQKSGALSIFASYEGPSNKIGFTLTAYATYNNIISWDESPPVSTYFTKVDGKLTSMNAGGNCTYPTFMVNPQYSLRILPPNESKLNVGKAQVTLVLQTKKDIPVNIAAVWSQGERITELVEKNICASSGAYTYGLARVSKELSVGDYTLIASAFEPQHMGSFCLKVDCSYPFVLKPIQQEGAGMYNQVIHDSWDAESAAGGPSHSLEYFKNPIFELDIPTMTQLKIRLQLAHPSNAIAINITLYPASTSTAALQRPVATSGDFDDAIAGVATPQVVLKAGKYWAIPSTYQPGVESDFKMIVYSSADGLKVRRCDI
ncbi:hypothetical protein BDQ17DRAFT_1344439 [Cyathus striatus]|nr:hypothetical protein BDQ17DRAFT_1344439 [Cyathus striatus]